MHSLLAKKAFSTHIKVAVLGAGAGGHAVSSQLANSGRFNAQDIVMFDPKRDHHYQPGYTMVGGGVLGTVAETKAKEATYIVRRQQDIIREGLGLRHETVTRLEPENNAFETDQGKRYTYDYLITSPGLVLRYDKIQGAKEALLDPESPVGSIYQLEYAYKMNRLREGFRGGKAIFMLPQMPVKCGGGPQKIMYLSEETFRRNGVRDKIDMHWYSTVGVMFPNCKKFCGELAKIRESKGITPHFFHDLYKIDKDARKAYFKDTKNNTEVVTDYDLLHIVPP
jgi:NADPH-dependent 2,4-dienoyl-CoA reductase/sulfur reductase-like enzyme